MVKTPKISIDFAGFQNRIKAQFSGLDANDPPSWPALPRYLLCLAVTVVVVVALWFLWLSSSDEELTAEQAKEVQLKEDYKKKLTQAVNLEALQKQREQVQQYVTQLEKQLPSKAEMDALLSDINQAGLGRSLQFELFRPGQVSVKEYYAELPIAVRVSGRYHDMGAFAADISNLSRIVTLNNLSITPLKDGMLTMDTTAKTFRYLDSEEVALQRKTAPVAGAKK
jgi:type IV pilus assembly protein PilO